MTAPDVLRVVVADDQTIVRDGLVALLDLLPEFEVVGTAGTARRPWRASPNSPPTSSSWTSGCRVSTASRPPGG